MGADDQSEAVQRRFEVLYLDESARVVRFLPDADSESEPQLIVFEREGAESLMEEVCSSCEYSLLKKIVIISAICILAKGGVVACVLQDKGGMFVCGCGRPQNHS